MKIEVVVARYCEDISWVRTLPKEWSVLVYDKSNGGPRQNAETSMWRSPDGPDCAPLWPGAIPMTNVGCEAHSYLSHIATHWDSLADITIFLQGNPHYVDRMPADIAELASRSWNDGFACLGPFLSCDPEGRPHHPDGLPELREMFFKFFYRQIPRELHWFAAAQFAATKERIRQLDLRSYFDARNVCMTKLHACAMERLWYEMLGKEH